MDRCHVSFIVQVHAAISNKTHALGGWRRACLLPLTWQRISVGCFWGRVLLHCSMQERSSTAGGQRACCQALCRLMWRPPRCRRSAPSPALWRAPSPGHPRLPLPPPQPCARTQCLQCRGAPPGGWAAARSHLQPQASLPVQAHNRHELAMHWNLRQACAPTDPWGAIVQVEARKDLLRSRSGQRELMTAYHMERGLALSPSDLACSTAKPKLSRSPAPMHVSVQDTSGVMFSLRFVRLTGPSHAG